MTPKRIAARGTHAKARHNGYGCRLPISLLSCPSRFVNSHCAVIEATANVFCLKKFHSTQD